MVFLLLACTATEAPAEDVETEPSIPPTYEVSDYATDDRQAATFDADLVEAGLQAAIDAALTAPADPVLTGYQAAMAYAEDSCPYTYEVDDNLFWYDSCTTSDGATFSGYGTLSAYEDIDLLGPTLVSVYRRAPNGTISFVIQRDYKLDCYADDYAMGTNFIWDFEIIDPEKGCMSDSYFAQSYRRMTDGLLRYTNAGTPSGQNSGAWTDTDPTNPLFPTPPQGEPPNPALAVAGYFDQGPVAKTGTIVLIAP